MIFAARKGCTVKRVEDAGGHPKKRSEMAFLDNIKFKPKMLGLFLFIGLVPLVIVAVISINKAEDAIMAESFNKLEVAREIKTERITDHFNMIYKNLSSYAANSAVVQAMQRFDYAFITGGTKGAE